MEKLAQYNKEKLIDLLTERLTFERTGVKLYDAILGRLQQSSDESFLSMIDLMQEHRDEEKEHEEWLEEQIRDLGGTAHEVTEMSQLVEKESKGIGDVILNPSSEISHLFHALLAAELVDNAGWDLLVALADEGGDSTARRAFKKRLHEEEDHLEFVRKVMERFAWRDVLNEMVRMPSSP